MEDNSLGSLEQQVARLTRRVYLLEELLRQRGLVTNQSAAPQDLAPAATVPPSPVAPSPVQMPPAAPASQPIAPPAFTQPVAKDDRSLESRIGSQWFNRIGILAVLIGMAWFLKLAIDNHWIGPTCRVLIGIVAGTGLIAWSERFRTRGYTAFSYSLKAVGSGILYLSLWAAYSLFHIIPATLAFCRHARRHRVQRLYGLVAGLGIVSALRHRRRLQYATAPNWRVSRTGTLLLSPVAQSGDPRPHRSAALVAPAPRIIRGDRVFLRSWSFRFYSNDQFALTALFLSLFFLLFAFAPHLVRINQQFQAASLSTRDAIALIILPLANASLGFLGFYLLVDNSGSSSAQPWIAVAFAAFYLLLLRAPNLPRHAVPPALRSLDLVIALIFLTLAIPLKTHGRWLTIGWLAEGAALLWLTRIVPQKLLRALAIIALGLGLAALLVVNPPASTAIIFNQRFATYLAGIAVFTFTAIFAKHSSDAHDPDFPFCGSSPLRFPY